MRLIDPAKGALVVGAVLMIAMGASLAQSPSPVQSQGPADIIKARQQHLKDVGKAAKAISDQLKSGSPDKDIVLASATDIDKILKDMPTWFPKGTGPEVGVKTAAKPEIWAQPDDFRKAYDNAQAAADKLAQVAATGDANAEATAFMSLGMNGCQNCHKQFRVKQENQ